MHKNIEVKEVKLSPREEREMREKFLSGIFATAHRAAVMGPIARIFWQLLVEENLQEAALARLSEKQRQLLQDLFPNIQENPGE